MPDAIPACFRAAAAPGGRASSASSGSGSGSSGAGTSLATSVYDTRLGLATLSWSRAALGLSLRAVLRVSSSAAPSPSASASDYGDGDAEVEQYECDGDDEEVAVRVRPWLLWRRRGCKRFRVRGRRVVDLAWDLSRARFPPSGSPEPCSGYFVAVVADGEMAVVAGDMAEEAYRKTKARHPAGPAPVLVSRREHVAMRDGGRGHRTCVIVRGKEREISVDLVSRAAQEKQQGRERDRAEVGMSVSVDGDRVLHVRRLRWKFRGTEKVDLGGGDRVLVSWDLHNWLFPARDTSPPDATAAAAALAAAVAPPAHAVFVFRFELAGSGGEERDPADDAKGKELPDKAAGGGGGWAGYVGRWGRGGDWSESSSNGEKRRRKSRLAKASSSSSASVASSSASWASGSTVMDWDSPEEAELQSGDGFSLLVYAWKN